MSKLLFKPVGIVSGLVSGLLARKLFDLVWRLVDEQDPPRAQHRRISVPKLALALALEGALFRAAKGLVDHASREGFARATGSWPGKEAPEAGPDAD